MNVTYYVELKTGYELSDNDVLRIKERIEENLRHLAGEYLAKLQVNIGYITPGPRTEVENIP